MPHGSSSLPAGVGGIPYAYGTEPERNARLSSSTLGFLAPAVLVGLFASELAEAPFPYAMDNEAQLSTAVVTAPHDTFLRRSATARAFARPKSDSSSTAGLFSAST